MLILILLIIILIFIFFYKNANSNVISDDALSEISSTNFNIYQTPEEVCAKECLIRNCRKFNFSCEDNYRKECNLECGIVN